MPIFSLLLLLVLFYVLTSSKSQIGKFYDLFTLACVLRIYWFQGYFLKVGNSEIANLGAIVEVVFTAYAIYLTFVKTIVVKRTYVIMLMFFGFVNLFGIVMEIIFPYDGLLLVEQSLSISWDALVAGKCNMYNYYPSFSDYIKPYFSLLQFGVNVILFKHVYDKSRFIKSYMDVIKLIKYGVYYGVFEFCIKNIIGNTTLTYDISALLVGVNDISVYKEAFMKNGLYTLQGLTREPSHYNCFLFTYIFLTMMGETILKYNREYDGIKTYGKLSIFMAVFLLLFSGGFSAVWYLFVLLLSFIVLKNNKKKISINIISTKMVYAVLISLVVVAIISYAIVQNDYMYHRLEDAFMVLDYIQEVDNVAWIASMGGNEGIGSTIARFFSTYAGFNIFLARPLFGLGYCLQFMHSFSMLFLANMGLIGVYSIYKLLACSKSRKYDSLLMFVVFIIGGLPITIAPLGLSMHWLLFFEATTCYKDVIEDSLG